MTLEQFTQKVQGGLIVSCQALPEEPLHSSYIMSRMAFAAKEGGAAGIRANTCQDIRAIKETVDLPVIGIIKKEYPDCPVYITTTIKEVDELAACGCEVIAADATFRPRANGQSLDDFFQEVRAKYPNQLFMADCSTYEEGIHAQELGFDFVGTTLCGYTPYTKGASLPSFSLIRKLGEDLTIPIIVEGGIWYPEQLKEALSMPGVLASVVGTAITRPRDITKHFVNAISKDQEAS